MSDFASVLGELLVKLDAAMKVIAQHPEVAAEVAAAIDTVIVPTAEQEEVLQDQARANALAVALRQAREVLPAPPKPEPVKQVEVTNVPDLDFGVTGPTGGTGAGATGGTGA